MVDLSHFRLSKLNTPEYRHFILLLFWPLFGITFYAAEQLIPRDYYHPMYHPVDDLIPFQELFVIPYLFWFVFLIGANVYTALWEPKACVKMMKFTIFTYGTGLLIFALFPTCQQLRPEEFARHNLLTRFMAWFYTFDTNTNVCPSLHVCGSIAAALGQAETERFGRGWRKPLLFLNAWLISISTVFVKQHSIQDVVCGLIICLFSWLLVYRNFQKINNTKSCAAKSCVV